MASLPRLKDRPRSPRDGRGNLPQKGGSKVNDGL
jgi:hypothetical protein